MSSQSLEVPKIKNKIRKTFFSYFYFYLCNFKWLWKVKRLSFKKVFFSSGGRAQALWVVLLVCVDVHVLWNKWWKFITLNFDMIICKNVVQSPTKCQWYKKTNSFHKETYNHPFHEQINIHNSDRKGIKHRMSYPRWSTSLVVNKQFWSDQSAVDQNEVRETSYLTILRPTLEYAAMDCDPTT
jgi:hypothetical protein